MNAFSHAQAESTQLACPHCHRVVRVPLARLGDDPQCPNCKSTLLSGKPVALEGASFAGHVERSSLPVLVDFWASWCGPCKMMAPVLDQLAARRARELQVCKVDTEANPELATRFNIRSIPTLILFRSNREIARQSGAVDLTTLSRWIDQNR